ncbi:MAG: NfeD family protein [Prochlorococcus sp.]
MALIRLKPTHKLGQSTARSGQIHSPLQGCGDAFLKKPGNESRDTRKSTPSTMPAQSGSAATQKALLPSTWMPLIWLVLAGLLLALGLAQPSVDSLIFAALGALLVSILSGIIAIPALLQILLFAGIALAGSLWLKRLSRRRHPSAAALRQSQDLAEVIAPICTGGEGRVRWQAQSWAAISIDKQTTLKVGDQVLVIGRHGTRLQVLPLPPL